MERKSYTRTFKAPPMSVSNTDTTVPVSPITSAMTTTTGPFVPETILRTVNSVQSKYDAPGEIDLGAEGRLLQEFLQFDGLTRQIIDAYDYWISDTLPKRITTTVIHFSLGTIKFEDVTVMNPTMILPGTQTRVKQYPHNARRDKTTYAISIYVTMKFYPKESEVATQEEKFKLGEIPVILGSKYCNLYGLSGKKLISKGECDKDPFAYFIIEGQEKIVLQHDKLRYNKPFIFPKDNKKPDNGMFEEFVNLNSKKSELSMIICRFTAMPTLDFPVSNEPKVLNQHPEIDAKKSTVVNLYYDLKTKSVLIKLDKFIPDTYLNIFYLYELYGVTDTEKTKNMILNYVPDRFKTKIMTFLNKGEMDYRLRQDIIAVLKGVMKMPIEIEKLTSEKQLEYYQERISEVFFKQTEGPIYKSKHEKYNAKLEMLSIMTARFSEYQTNCREIDQRDSWSNKRVVSAGPAMEHLFNQIWNSMVLELVNDYLSTVTVNERTFEISGAHARLSSNIIKDTFVRSFNPNTWGIQQSIMKENMTDFLKNETLLAKYSQILKISPETSDKGKQTSIREVNFTQTGYICSIETPEGKQCGIVKGLSVGCYISIGRDESVIAQYVKQSKLVSLEQSEVYDSAFVLNGKFIGWCEGKSCEMKLKIARRNMNIHRDTMIYFEEPKILWVYCDGGRPTRPLLIVNEETGRLVIDEKDMWNAGFYDLLKEGAIEYIDALEQEFSCVVAQSIWDPVFQLSESNSIQKRSTTSQRNPYSIDTFNEIVGSPKYTHCEMDPNAILSLVASIIPMPDRSQAPRNTYQTSMGKQALSIQNTNAINRFDTEVKSLAYPSPTLFETQMYKYIGLDELPIGETVMVAMMSYGGWNQEDSIIINQAAVDRGRFRIVRTITYKTVQLSGNKDFVESIQKPMKKVSNMDSLDDDGVVRQGTYVRQGDCLIGKVKKILRTREVVDASVYVGVGDSGIVERVLKTTTAESRKIVMVKIREVRKIRAGDKCACFSQETDILTKNRGWISIKDVTTNDLVASLENGNLKYVHPEATQEYDYEGDMYQLLSNQVDLFVTPNHNLYVKKRTSNVHELVRADEAFGKRVNHKKNAKNNTPDQEFFILPGCTYNYKGKEIIAEEKMIPMNSWLKLFGIWIAEGCANEKHIKICGHKQRVRDVLDEIESELGVQFSKSRDKNFDETLQCVYYILDRQFCSYFTEWSLGAVNKKLPEWCFELSQTQSQILLSSMILGDGHISKNNCVKYYTSSKQLADDVQVIALHAGWSANSKKRFDAGHRTWFESRQEYITSTADAYDITIVTKKNEPQINHGHKNSQKGQKEEWVPYNGKVYCCTVPSGVIYIRHNKKPVWCGNSRYAQKGTVGIVMPSESMPVVMSGPNAGMIPDLIINPHCFTGDSQVGLYNGLSRKISSFSPEGCEMVWTIGDKGMVGRHSLGMTTRGVKDIVQVTLLDGRKIRCTPEHKFVTNENGQRVSIEAQHLTGKEVFMGLECVEDIIGDDESNWQLLTKHHTFKMDTQLNRDKTLAFARILGYVLTDGTLCKIKNTESISSPITLGCQMDLNTILQDIHLITGKRPKCRKDSSIKGNVFVFNIPGSLSNSMGDLEGITIGRRTIQEASWPDFLLKDDCPKSVLREFVAGLFGGDGHAPGLLRDKLVPIHFSNSICTEFIDSLKTKMTQLCDMMKKVGVDAKISRIRKCHSNSESYILRPRTQCEIVVPNLLDFGEKIGFRYCIQKMSKLSAAIGYVRLQENVRKQMAFVNQRTGELFDDVNRDKKITLKDCLEKARNELREKECILNEYYSLSNIQTLGNRRKATRSLTLKSFDYDYFPTFDKYLEQIGCLDWFKKHTYVNGQDDDFVSTYHMKVLDVRPCGQEEVFDIGVSEFHYFSVSSVCVANCIPSRMTIGKMIEIMTSKVAAMTGKKVNATAFRKFDLDAYSDELSKLGFDRHGSEMMMNGMTGEMFENPIFMGPCYYQALKHHVQDKIQQRGRGPVKITTRQPTAGRTKGGGKIMPQWTIKCLLVRNPSYNIYMISGKIFKFRENPKIFFTKSKGKLFGGFGENSKVWS